MFFNTLKAEWTKLRTTRSFWWTTALALFFAWGWAILNAKLTEKIPPEALEAGVSPLTPDSALAVLSMLSLPVLMIQAVMVVTTEYRYRMQTMVYMDNPNRWMVALVKLLMYAAIAAIITFIAVVGAYLLTDLFAEKSMAEAFKPWEGAGRRLLWQYPLAAALLVLFAQGVGLLLRQTAGAVALCLILYLGIDSIVSMLPKVGDKIVNFMPFSAFNAWLRDAAPENAPWDHAWGSGLVFLAWAVGLWILGLIFLQKRDA